MARINWDGHYIQGLRDLLAYNYTPLALNLLKEYNGGITVNPEDPNFLLEDARQSLYQQYANQWYKTPKTLAELQGIMENAASVRTGYEWGMPSYIPKDIPDSYGTITSGDKSVTVDSSGNISGSGSTSGESVKTPKKEQGLQKLTSDISTTSSEKPKVANTTKAPVSTNAPVAPIQIARPDYTNVAYGSQVQPMAPTQPAESPIDESYYRYLRNNGWNDFDARRQAIRYY